jgi:hypothetical protein
MSATICNYSGFNSKLGLSLKELKSSSAPSIPLKSNEPASKLSI